MLNLTTIMYNYKVHHCHLSITCKREKILRTSGFEFLKAKYLHLTLFNNTSAKLVAG